MEFLKYLILVLFAFRVLAQGTAINHDHDEPEPQKPLQHPAHTDPVICGMGLNSSAGGADAFYTVEGSWNIPQLDYRDGQVLNWLALPPHTQGIALGGGSDLCFTQLRASTRSVLVGENSTATRIDIEILPHPWFHIPVNMSSFEIMVNDTIEASVSITSPKTAQVIFVIHPTYDAKSRNGGGGGGPQTANYTITLLENGHETWANITLQNWDGHRNLDLLKHREKDHYFQHLNARNVSFCTDSAWWFVTEATFDRFRPPSKATGEREYVPRFGRTSFTDMKVGSSKYEEDKVRPEEDPDAKYYEMVNGDDAEEKLCFVESVERGKMVLRDGTDEQGGEVSFLD